MADWRLISDCNWAVFDIDSTLFDDSHRKHLLNSAKPGKQETFWPYHDLHPKDTVNDFIRQLMVVAFYSGNKIMLLTARPEKYRTSTVKQLSENGIVYDALVMRPEWNTNTSPDFKFEIISEMKYSGNTINMFVDDRIDTITAMQTIGIPCLHYRQWPNPEYQD